MTDTCLNSECGHTWMAHLDNKCDQQDCNCTIVVRTDPVKGLQWIIPIPNPRVHAKIEGDFSSGHAL